MVQGSEDGAAGAASRAQVFLDLGLEERSPRDDDRNNVLLHAVVRRAADVAFLAALPVDHAQGLHDGALRIFGANDIHRVDTGRGEVASGSRGGEANGPFAGTVSDDGVDGARVVRVLGLVDAHADELVRGHEVVQPLRHLFRQLIPVLPAAREHTRVSVRRTCDAAVPDGLAASVAHVLGGAGDGNDVWFLSIDRERVGSVKLLVPGVRDVLGRDLDDVERCLLKDRPLAVEERDDVLALFDVRLVRRDRDELAARQLLRLDEIREVFRILLRAAVDERLDSRFGRGSRLPSLGHCCD